MRDVQSILVFGLAASSIVTAKAKNINWKILVTRTKTTAKICKQMLDLTQHAAVLLLLLGLWLGPPAVLLLLSAALDPAAPQDTWFHWAAG